MLYVLVLSFALAGHVEDYQKTCPDLPCVVRMMERARAVPGLVRIQVFHGRPKLLAGGPVFPPFVDEWIQ